jgi:hypothetical protein
MKLFVLGILRPRGYRLPYLAKQYRSGAERSNLAIIAQDRSSSWVQWFFREVIFIRDGNRVHAALKITLQN